MSATIELKYFNSFWLKKMQSVVDVLPTPATPPPGPNKATATVSPGAMSFTLQTDQPNIGIGQAIYYTIGGQTYTLVIKSFSGSPQTINLMTAVTAPGFSATTDLTFGDIIDFKYVPGKYSSEQADWYIEEARIRGGYNNISVDFGVKAYIVEDNNNQQNRSNSLIYSGIFNSRTGVNNTNQFSVAEDITRSVDPSNGSIQKLYAEDTNLIIFQESKVSRALIDKDAIYTAEGQPMTTSGIQVIGQIQSYSGNYGISTNPESFAVYGYRKYFVDKNQNVVLRLSQDGITEISAYGMLDFFRDKLSKIGNKGRIVGGWDAHNKQYVLSMQPSTSTLDNKGAPYAPFTLAFDEDSLGWVSFYSYIPNYMDGLLNNYYSFKFGCIWEHYSTAANRAQFYGATPAKSSVTFVFNSQPSLIKNFNTINYEGTLGWQVDGIITDTDNSIIIYPAWTPQNLADLQANLFANNFKIKENKYFANIFNNTSAGNSDVVWGQSMSGVKGIYATCSMSLDNDQYAKQGELYACSTEYVESSY
jgi:hypothetical protein